VRLGRAKPQMAAKARLPHRRSAAEAANEALNSRAGSPSGQIEPVRAIPKTMNP